MPSGVRAIRCLAMSLATPGHSPGHVSLFCDGDRVLVAGDAVTTTRLRLQATGGKPDRQAGIAPGGALAFDVGEPGVSVAAEPVMHVQGDHFKPLRLCGMRSGVKQGRGIAAPAEGDRDDPPHGKVQRSLVSVNRP